MVVAITASLQGKAAAWAADLFSDHARELGDIGLFLEALRAQFEDPSRVQQAEAEVLGLRQKGLPVREYVREFQRVAGQLRTWPEHLLVYHFRRGLDKDLRQACVVRGVPSRLQDWFRVVSELDTGLQEFRGSMSDQSLPRRTGPWPTEVSGQPTMFAPSVRPTFRCFRCNRPGHRVAECPVPALTTTPRSQERPSPTQKKTPEHSRAARQMEEGTPQHAPTTAPPAIPDDSLAEYNNTDPDEDPMVSQPICPFAIPISLMSPTTGHTSRFQALIDSGSTRCLVSRGVVKKMGVKELPVVKRR
ncbi:RTL1: Retrotransposon-like 1 [Crotalus adamanteus]|uniref:RTL1: Retrotransposon-like 1 n=1 Tax=Crotalus adamanteus TaxID=8729 RepID=A0AAW1B1J2_CROAD